MSTPYIIPLSWPSFCQKLAKFVAIWQSYSENNSDCFFSETQCNHHQCRHNPSLLHCNFYNHFGLIFTILANSCCCTNIPLLQCLPYHTVSTDSKCSDHCIVLFHWWICNKKNRQMIIKHNVNSHLGILHYPLISNRLTNFKQI